MALRLALLWHMHQPCYHDPSTGRFEMPWVFLHAAKDYCEMLNLALEGGARVTFNFVPILLDQLHDYKSASVADSFVQLAVKDPEHLSGEEKVALATQLSMLHLENQAKRFARLYDLVTRMGRRHRAGDSATPSFTRQEWIDLTALYLLAWTGETIRAKSPFMSELAHRGENFSQDEKLKLIDELCELSGSTDSYFKSAAKDGKIEVSATPYCHPILPLLLDVRTAREAVPDITLPRIDHAVFAGDAARQVREAVARHAESFGSPPNGFWPSEGSVSREALGLLAANAVKWAATDEDILAASLGKSLSGSGRADLYKPWRYSTEHGDIKVFFRDKALSDLIGFVYSTWPAKAAANDFVGRLRQIGAAHGPDAIITVALDGENAWEHYAENGAPFLRELYAALGASDIKLATFSDLLDEQAPTLPRIQAGSWIYGSFTTWCGHPEKNRAWELLAETRKRVGEKESSLGAAQREKVWKHLRIAEGSDWFWWLGDDHYTPLAGRFDQLFRSRLMAIYREMGEAEPASLRLPIKRIGRRGLVVAPRNVISPKIDGAAGSFFKWFESGVFDLAFDAGSMHRTDAAFSTLHFGGDRNNLYLCLKSPALLANLSSGCVLEVLEGPNAKVVLKLGVEICEHSAGVAAAMGDAVEISLPLSILSRDGENRVNIAFRLARDGEEVERAPMVHMAEFVPEVERNLGGWSV